MDIRALLAEVLASNEYKVTEAESSAAVQKALTGEQPDVVVLDVKLGQDKEDERAGLDLLPQIKKRWPDTEVIMLTGQGTVEMAVEAGRTRRLQFPLQTIRNRETAGRRQMRSRTQGAEPGEQRLAPRSGNDERQHLAGIPQRHRCRTSCARSNASRPATFPFSSPAKAAPAKKSSPI